MRNFIFRASNNASANAVQEKSKQFTIRIVKPYQCLCGEVKEFMLSKQVLQSGTSVGANWVETECAVSRKAFLAKAISHTGSTPRPLIGWRLCTRQITFQSPCFKACKPIVWSCENASPPCLKPPGIPCDFSSAIQFLVPNFLHNPSESCLRTASGLCACYFSTLRCSG